MKYLKLFEEYKHSDNLKVDTLDFSEFFKKIYGSSGGSPNDETIYDRIRYLSEDDFHYTQKDIDPHFIVLEKEDKIIGIAKLAHYPYYDNNVYSISYFSIDKNYRNKGYSRIMADELFKYAKNNNWTINTSKYSYVGFKKLRPILNEYAIKYNVTFIDRKDDDELHDGKWMYDSELNHIDDQLY